MDARWATSATFIAWRRFTKADCRSEVHAGIHYGEIYTQLRNVADDRPCRVYGTS